MTEKKPTSINLRVDHRNWMDEKNINRSDLVNDLLEKYRNGERSERAAKEYRREQLSVDVAKLQSELETKQEQLERIESELNNIESEKQQEKQELITEAVAHFTPEINYRSMDTREQIPGPDDKDMQWYAEQVGMDVVEFRELIVDRVLSEVDDE